MFKRYLLAASLVLSTAFAQPLADLLPAETFFALGTKDLTSEQNRIQPFIDEFNRLDLASSLSKVFSSETDTEAQTPLAIPEALQGLGPMDILGQEAWLAVSASRFNPLPTLTLLSQLSDSASANFDELLAKASEQEGVQMETEGSINFYQQLIESEGSPPVALAFAKQDSLLMLSTNPDTLRGVLRQLQGSSDPSFADSEGYKRTLAELDGSFMGYLDYAQLPEALASYTKGLGFDKLVERLTDAFETAGVSAGVSRFTDTGMVSESYQAYDPKGKDKELLELLRNPTQADPGLKRFYAPTALGFSANPINLAAWWNYLNGITESTPELGGSLDELLQSFTAINLQESLFSWTGEQFASSTTGASESPTPGVAASNLLGEQVFIIEVKDETKARDGLASLFATASQGVAAFADPSGGSGNAASETKELNGVTVTSYEITSGVKLSYAITEGYALIATSDEALSTVLSAAGDTGISTAIPTTARSYSLADNRRSMEASAEQLVSQLQLAAGFGGASNLNFEAVDEASQKLETYLQFIAERLGQTVSYSEQRPESIYSFSQSDISW